MSGLSEWREAACWLPECAIPVLVSDGEGHCIAYWEASTETWYDAATDLPMDSVVQHWMMLPEIPAV